MSLFTPTRRAAATLRCDAALVYEILTDYDNYVEWLPHLAQSKSLATEGDLAIAEFVFAAPRKERFVVECIHTRNKMVLWRSIEGKIPVTQVEWTIAAAGDAQSQVTLAVTGLLSLNPLQPGPGRFLNSEQCLKALQGQASSFTPEIALADESGEKILDLVETDEGVVCWIRGKKYVLRQEGADQR
jgi:ribosome-associated toxin RatA of RatAB toxin-antitoxin module